MINLRANIKKAFGAVFLISCLSAPLFSAVAITNLSVSPGTAAQNSDVTVQFDLDMGSGTNLNTYFAVGLTEYNLNPPLRCGSDWVATNAGIYKNVNTYWHSGSTFTAAVLSTTIVEGFTNGGLAGPSWGGSIAPPKHVSLVVTIPPEYTSQVYYLFVAAKASAAPNMSYNCELDPLSYDDLKMTPVTVLGTQAPYKVDLEFYGQASNALSERMFISIYNWSESGLRSNRLSVRYYVSRTVDAAWAANNSPGVRVKLPGGVGASALSNDVLSMGSLTSVPLPAATCAFSRRVNRYIEMYMPDPQSGKTDRILIPPAGGRIETLGEYDIGPAGGNNTTGGEDTLYYSQADDNQTGYADYRYVTLHLDGTHICEWDNATTPDDQNGAFDNMGEMPCGTPGTCAGLPTKTITPVPTATVTPTVTNTVMPTATVTLTVAGTPVVIGEEESFANPNPATFYVYFNYNMPKPAENIRVDIINFAGRYVGFVEEKSINMVVAKIKLNLYKFAPGMYYYITRIKYMDGEQVKYKPAKFMVAK